METQQGVNDGQGAYQRVHTHSQIKTHSATNYTFNALGVIKQASLYY